MTLIAPSAYPAFEAKVQYCCLAAVLPRCWLHCLRAAGPWLVPPAAWLPLPLQYSTRIPCCSLINHAPQVP